MVTCDWCQNRVRMGAGLGSGGMHVHGQGLQRPSLCIGAPNGCIGCQTLCGISGAEAWYASGTQFSSSEASRTQVIHAPADSRPPVLQVICKSCRLASKFEEVGGWFLVASAATFSECTWGAALVDIQDSKTQEVKRSVPRLRLRPVCESRTDCQGIIVGACLAKKNVRPVSSSVLSLLSS